MLKSSLAHVWGEAQTIRSRFASVMVATCILLASVIISLVFAELFLRWYYRDVLTSAGGRTYFYYHSVKKFDDELNAYHLRGKFFEVKSKHVMRVVVLGDSLAFGHGVWPYTKTFPELVKKMFMEKYPNRDLEILNLGLPGHNLRHHNKYLTKFVLLLKPDYVLYQWYINDMNYRTHITKFKAPPLVPDKRLDEILTEKSVVYFLLTRAWNQIRVKSGDQVDYIDYLTKKFKDPKSRSSKLANKLLNRMLDRLEKEGIGCGIVLFPSLANKMSGYKLGFLHEQVLNVCRERNIPCLDLRKAYGRYDEPLEELWANTFDYHPSALAHRVAAEEINRFFGPKWAESIDLKVSRRESGGEHNGLVKTIHPYQDGVKPR